MLTGVLTFVSLVLSTLMGWLILAFFFPKTFDCRLEKLGLSFGLGLGIVTFIEIIFLYLGIKISPPSLLLPIILISAVLALSNIKRGQSFQKIAKSENFNLASKVILFFIIIQGAWIIIRAFNFPVMSDDGVAIWGLKAKAIYFSNLWGQPFSAIIAKIRPTLSGNYPLLIPLAENYVNLFFKQYSDLAPKIISPMYYFAFLLAFFGLLKRLSDKNYALIFTFFLASLTFLADSASDAIADLAFSYYYSLGFILIILWMRERKNSYLYLSGIFSGLLIWTKNEGYPCLLINIIIIIIFCCLNFKSRGKELLKGLGGFFVLIIPAIALVTYYERLTGVQEGIINSQTFSFTRLVENLGRLPYILYELQRQLLGTPNRWNILGYLFILTVLIRFKKALCSVNLYTLLAIALNFVLYITVYLLTPQEVSEHMGTSLNRVLMHFIPLMVFFAAATLYRDNKSA